MSVHTDVRPDLELFKSKYEALRETYEGRLLKLAEWVQHANSSDRLQVANDVTIEIEGIKRDYHQALESSAEDRMMLADEIRYLQSQLSEGQTRTAQATSSALRLEHQLREEKSTNAKLESDIHQVNEKHRDLACRHQKLKYQVQSLGSTLKERDKSIQFFEQQRKDAEAVFHDVVARMETLLEAEAKKSVSAVKDLRNKAVHMKARLMEDLKQQTAACAELSEALSTSRGNVADLVCQIKTEAQEHKLALAAAAAREKLLEKELQESRDQVEMLSQSIAEVARQQSSLAMETANAKATAAVLEAKVDASELQRARNAGCEDECGRTPTFAPFPSVATTGSMWAGGLDWTCGGGTAFTEAHLARKLEEANVHISQLTTLLSKEVQRREEAELEVTNAQGLLDSSQQDLTGLKELGDRLEKLGNQSLIQIEEKDKRIIDLERELHKAAQVVCAMPAPAPSPIAPLSKEKGVEMLRNVSTLRSCLRGMKAQVQDGQETVKQLLSKALAALQVDIEKEIKIKVMRKITNATTQLEREKEMRKSILMAMQGVSSTLLEKVGLSLPASLVDETVYEEPSQARSIRGGIEEFVTGLDQVLAGRQAKSPLKDQSPPKGFASTALETSTAACLSPRQSDDWGTRSKDDFRMLAELKKIETESEVQSLKTHLEEMKMKLSRAVDERNALARHLTSSREAEGRMKVELERMASKHSADFSTVEVRLAQETARCQDLRSRLARMAREHQVIMKESEGKHLLARQELEKIHEEMGNVRNDLERERARRRRVEHRYKELEDASSLTPSSLSPKLSGSKPLRSSVDAEHLDLRVADTGTLSRAGIDSGNEELGREKAIVAGTRSGVSSVQLVLEEAREKLNISTASSIGSIPSSVKGEERQITTG
ncbi:unnamed protein product [Discosporangium mesarthrocarpum]